VSKLLACVAGGAVGVFGACCPNSVKMQKRNNVKNEP